MKNDTDKSDPHPRETLCGRCGEAFAAGKGPARLCPSCRERVDQPSSPPGFLGGDLVLSGFACAFGFFGSLMLMGSLAEIGKRFDPSVVPLMLAGASQVTISALTLLKWRWMPVVWVFWTPALFTALVLSSPGMANDEQKIIGGIVLTLMAVARAIFEPRFHLTDPRRPGASNGASKGASNGASKGTGAAHKSEK